MTGLAEALTRAGLTPPQRLTPARWLRFPGIGKPRSNRSGWCRLITPTLAIYGDWSSGLSATWIDQAHQHNPADAKLLQEAKLREQQFARETRERQKKTAVLAQQMIDAAAHSTHAYLARKGFPARLGLVLAGKLLIPVRDARDYARILSVQEIAEDGQKRFLAGGRVSGGIYRLGCPIVKARKVILCEGFATGLSLEAALARLPGPTAVVVCFCARNLELIAQSVRATLVCTDHDASQVGQRSAERTGLPWVMPADVGDFNDLHQRAGLQALIHRIREA